MGVNDHASGAEVLPLLPPLVDWAQAVDDAARNNPTSPHSQNDGQSSPRQRMGSISSSRVTVRYAPTPSTTTSRVGARIKVAYNFYTIDLT